MLRTGSVKGKGPTVAGLGRRPKERGSLTPGLSALKLAQEKHRLPSSMVTEGVSGKTGLHCPSTQGRDFEVWPTIRRERRSPNKHHIRNPNSSFPITTAPAQSPGTAGTSRCHLHSGNMIDLFGGHQKGLIKMYCLGGRRRSKPRKAHRRLLCSRICPEPPVGAVNNGTERQLPLITRWSWGRDLSSLSC